LNRAELQLSREDPETDSRTDGKRTGESVHPRDAAFVYQQNNNDPISVPEAMIFPQSDFSRSIPQAPVCPPLPLHRSIENITKEEEKNWGVTKDNRSDDR